MAMPAAHSSRSKRHSNCSHARVNERRQQPRLPEIAGVLREYLLPFLVLCDYVVTAVLFW